MYNLTLYQMECVLFMPLINLIVIYLYRKHGVPLNNFFFSKNGPEVHATLNLVEKKFPSKGTA